MKSKIIKFLIVIIAIVLLGVLFVFTGSTSDKHPSICNNILDNIKLKKNMLVFINGGDFQEFDDLTDKFRKKYEKDVVFYQIKGSAIDNKCYSSYLKDIDVFDELKSNHSSMILVYKDGNLVGRTVTNDFYSLEDYVSKLNVIKKIVLEETVTSSTIGEKIKSNAYFLMIVNDDDLKLKAMENMKQVFGEYKYDVVNYKTDEGSKIFKLITDEYDISQFYPKIMYFKDGKLIADDTLLKVDDLKNFRNEYVK